MHKFGVVAGVVAGVLDVVLIAVADASAGLWSVAGWLVVVSPSRLAALLHGVVVTVLLNLPWYIAFGPGSGHWDHVPPLVGMSIVFGLGFGVVRKKAA